MTTSKHHCLETLSGLALAASAVALSEQVWLPQWIVFLIQGACIILGSLQCACWCFECLPCSVITQIMARWTFAAVGIIAFFSHSYFACVVCVLFFMLLGGVCRVTIRKYEATHECHHR